MEVTHTYPNTIAGSSIHVNSKTLETKSGKAEVFNLVIIFI